jgi:predicted metal-binding membrane protein
MVVVGSMNILWMAAITVVLSLERVVCWGDRLARWTGVAAGLGGGSLVSLALL